MTVPPTEGSTGHRNRAERGPLGPPLHRPLVIAHRAGNDAGALEEAEALGVDLIEADVFLFRGRLDVRHHKSIGPLPVYWERWELRSRRDAVPTLRSLLEGVAPHTRLMLDLKGFDPRIGGRVRAALDRHPELAGRIVVCSRHWGQLRQFAALPEVTSVYSAGSRMQARLLLARYERPQGVSIRCDLLDARLAARIRAATSLLMAWPVNSVETMRRMAKLGVNGMISDRPGVLCEGLRQ